jgi:hypothetical protein
MLKKVGAPPPVPATPIETEDQISTDVEQIKEPALTQPLQTTPPPPKLPPEQPIPKPSVTSKVVKPPKISSSSIELKEQLSVVKEVTQPAETVIKPEIPQLKLKPEDFMVRAKPKMVKIVPKDAKSKLKMSSDSQVEKKKEIKAPVPVSPLKLMEQKAKSSPRRPESKTTSEVSLKPEIQQIPPVKPIEIKKDSIPNEIKKEVLEPKVQKTPKIIAPQQRERLTQNLMDLKIKKTHLTKMSLDFDMQELTGEISAEELKDKKEKVKIMMDKITAQIQDIENMLGE